MHEFKIWAPSTEKVTLKIGERSYPMSRAG